MSVKSPHQRILLKTISIIFLIAFLFTVALVVKSCIDFSHSGPQVQDEILNYYKGYLFYAMGRLAFWAFIIASLLIGIGALLYAALAVALNRSFHWYGALLAGCFSFGVLSSIQFSRHLLFIPSSIVASLLYRNSRFYFLWHQLNPERLLVVQWLLLVGVLSVMGFCGYRFLKFHRKKAFSALSGVAVFYVGLFLWAAWAPEPVPVRGNTGHDSNHPNIVMIGGDSMRADRFGLSGYSRELTPFIDSIGKKGFYFKNFYIPLGRTAPSLTSFLTSSWPHTHGIRDNFIGDDEVFLPVRPLPQILSEAGYRTVAIADWAGGDLKKLKFGFDEVDAPDDQWNMKFLIRQGPKDIRLFLSLFTHNRFGKVFLPEVYYLAGIPLNTYLDRSARAKINELANQNKPFFMMLFMGATHAPCGSEYPYYNLFASPEYDGESLFCISGLTTPEEVVKKQGMTKRDFDLQQVVDLYDGAVRGFDDRVKSVVEHLEACGLSENTIVVVFSDHGMELFDRDTWGQGNEVAGNDASARVPLLIYDPRQGKGKVVTQTARSVDFMPTLLEMAGVTLPVGVEGTSLVPVLNDSVDSMHLSAFYETGIWLNQVPGMLKDHLAYPKIMELLEIKDKNTGTFSIKKEYLDVVISAKDRMVRDDRWKLTYMPTTKSAVYSLYDMTNDPLCQNDLSDEHPDLFLGYKKDLVEWMSGDKKIAFGKSDYGKSPDEGHKVD